MNETKVDKRDNLYKYADLVRRAKLDSLAKSLLWHYAYSYNWDKKKHSWYSQETICALVGISKTTYYKKRRYLESLGWIEIIPRNRQTCLVKPLEGIDDPDYETQSWAKWHPLNKPKQMV